MNTSGEEDRDEKTKTDDRHGVGHQEQQHNGW